MDREKALELHRKYKGKIEVVSKLAIDSPETLALAYTPGVAEVCKEIQRDPEKARIYTSGKSTVAVVTNGTAVLGLGDIGPLAGLSVMEGKAALFKEFGGVDAFPILVDSKDPDEIVNIVEKIAPGFGGINLEDIAAPQCFEIERALDERLNIPVFHDDQHGTAIVVLAALINGLKLADKEIEKCKVVISGAGAAGVAIARILIQAGVGQLLVTNRHGILADAEDLDPDRREIARLTNPYGQLGTLADALDGADVFIGVSGPGVLKADMVRRMNEDSIILALANPEPEIYPDEAYEAGALVVGTGRSDFPNQVNNVLVFPGIFKGAFEAGVRSINPEMMLAAAIAIANLVGEELSPNSILPSVFDSRVAEAVAKAVIKEA